PDHPRLFGFIEFWQKNIEGPLHSVRFTHRKLISAGEWRHVTHEITLH
ncbi:MAG: aspartate-semialdehyde dehydrogenase, partial [Gemmobacter sp.]